METSKTEELKKEIGYNLKIERQKRNLKQEDVAKKLYMRRESYTHYETGKNMITVENLISIADWWGISMDYICGRYKKTDA